MLREARVSDEAFSYLTKVAGGHVIDAAKMKVLPPETLNWDDILDDLRYEVLERACGLDYLDFADFLDEDWERYMRAPCLNSMSHRVSGNIDLFYLRHMSIDYDYWREYGE